MRLRKLKALARLARQRLSKRRWRIPPALGQELSGVFGDFTNVVVSSGITPGEKPVPLIIAEKKKRVEGGTHYRIAAFHPETHKWITQLDLQPVKNAGTKKWEFLVTFHPVQKQLDFSSYAQGAGCGDALISHAVAAHGRNKLPIIVRTLGNKRFRDHLIHEFGAVGHRTGVQWPPGSIDRKKIAVKMLFVKQRVVFTIKRS